MRLVADELGEVVDHLRVGEVLALRGGGHHQVVLHQPDDQGAVPGRKMMAAGEGFGVYRAQLRMITATTLADVVIQAGEVNQLGFWQLVDQLAGQREFLRQLRPAELAQVLDQVEGVRVDRIDVEQVVLHLPNDMAELRQITAENAVAVHPPQVAVNAFLALEQFDEQAGVADVLAELVVDQVAAVTQQADAVGTYPFDFRVLRHQHEDFDDGEGGALEHVRVGDLDIAVAHLEAAVQGRGRAAFAGAQDHFLEVLIDQVRQLGNPHHHAVVLLHEVFDAALAVAVLIAEQGGDLHLVIEQQAVFGAPGEHVQGVAHLPQKFMAGGQQGVFAFQQETVADQGLQVQRAELAACHPKHGLDVAQAAGRALDVGFEVVLGVVVLGMTRSAFVALGQVEMLARPHLIGAGHLLHALAQVFGAGDGAAFHQVGDHRQVGARLFGAFVDRAHALADFQADVPEQGEKAFDGLAEDFVIAAVEQDQQVDVRVWV